MPSKAVCTKHRAMCTQQTRSSRGGPDPFRSRGLPLTDLRNGSAYIPFGTTRPPNNLFPLRLIPKPSPHFCPQFRSVDLSQGAAGTGKHTCKRDQLGVSFICPRTPDFFFFPPFLFSLYFTSEYRLLKFAEMEMIIERSSSKKVDLKFGR